jgi:hypothetical protein
MTGQFPARQCIHQHFAGTKKEVPVGDTLKNTGTE